MADSNTPTTWGFCVCGHPWMHHDVHDLEDRYPTCCVEECDCPNKHRRDVADYDTGKLDHD